MRFLLIEDDKMLGESLQILLRKSGYAVDWGMSLDYAGNALKTTMYDLLLLDLGLADGDGASLLKQVRSSGKNIPVIVITARDALQEKIKLLDLGADDYVLKPFAYEELDARIRARLRRGHEGTMPVITIGPLALNPANKTCAMDGREILLSAKEYAILLTLVQQPARYFTRPELEDRIYDWSRTIESNAIEYHIHQLRRKCGKDIIINNRGLGYRLGIVDDHHA